MYGAGGLQIMGKTGHVCGQGADGKVLCLLLRFVVNLKQFLKIKS